MILTKKDLIESEVEFKEADHTYNYKGRRFSGITSLIHNILGLGIYPDSDDYTKEHIIPRAGSRGTAVHHAIQTYDETGMFDDTQIVTTKYGSFENGNIRYVDEEWGVGVELRAYIKHLTGFRPVANEYTVSDRKMYASQIDNVWQNHDTEGIWLVDTKTNNLDYYPLCGYFNPRYFKSRESALKEYLSWQLSVYAYLFELQNPTLKVEGLACNWLRPDKSAFWVIHRQPDYLVEELLKTEAMLIDGEFVYYHHNPEIFGIKPSTVEKAAEPMPILPNNVVSYMADLNAKVVEYENKLKEAKEGLRAAMNQHGVDRCDLGLFSATLSADTTAKTFDTARFKKENPELYAKYLVEKEKKGSLLIKFK